MGLRVAYWRYTHGDLNYMGSVTALMFFMFGVQLIATGLMCEYISRIYIEVQNRPYYIVKEVVE